MWYRKKQVHTYIHDTLLLNKLYITMYACIDECYNAPRADFFKEYAKVISYFYRRRRKFYKEPNKDANILIGRTPHLHQPTRTLANFS